MSSKEKGKFEEMAKGDKARYDREMKNYVPPKGEKKGKKKDPNAPKRPPWVFLEQKKTQKTPKSEKALIVWYLITVFCFRSAFFLFCSEHRPKIKNEHPGLSIGDTAKKLGEMWSEQSAKDKQPYEQKAAKLKEKYEKVQWKWQSDDWSYRDHSECMTLVLHLNHALFMILSIHVNLCQSSKCMERCGGGDT